MNKLSPPAVFTWRGPFKRNMISVHRWEATCSIDTTSKCINLSTGELPIRPLDVGLEFVFYRTTSTAPEPRSKVRPFSRGSQFGTLFPFCFPGASPISVNWREVRGFCPWFHLPQVPFWDPGVLSHRHLPPSSFHFALRATRFSLLKSKRRPFKKAARE